MEMKLAFAQILTTEFYEVLVMGEKKDLSAFGQGSELRENGRCTLVVKGNKQIIQNQRHWLVLLKVAIKRRKAESQE